MKTNEFLKQLRHDFARQQLSKNDVLNNPFEQFKSWLDEAVEAQVNEPIATTIATVSKYGQPSARIVYIREITENGFVFFTNYLSKKGVDISANPKGCMNLFWPELERQIRIEGIIEKVPHDVSDAYFADRPKASQIGAHASRQSQPIASRKELEERIHELTNKYNDEPVPRPSNWGGYILVPHHFEFWQGRPNRLHDRVAYNKDDDSWKIVRLNP
ncbi:pyridoxamine 5'-phosphate oxidase [Parvicella tangerina]|uniref:Pyridoxine/pyridoxamine 5'-phosphate oxidase n=1 Tax=Parvicella tangerina TaxID=2829795 RepID=A0A916NHX5_9FLAO|nr:pyridoxamine 5'-phosphate oxidase [Parvicella tangerina]CAG5083986.1 Pyridoxine/pyridoxamine 5'-phosphate oxidase [Parvicella tangerina]